MNSPEHLLPGFLRQQLSKKGQKKDGSGSPMVIGSSASQATEDAKIWHSDYAVSNSSKGNQLGRNLKKSVAVQGESHGIRSEKKA